MGALKRLAAAGMLLYAVPAHGSNVERWRPYIAEAAARFAIPEDWIARVMQAESGGRTTLGGRPITSPKGAMGLMQLMPSTWAEMRARLDLGIDPYDPRDNILAGAGYLRMMHDRFGYPGLFAAYNAGPKRYAEHLSSARSLPADTIAYVAGLASGRAPSRPVGRPSDTIFFTLRAIDFASSPALAQRAKRGIFVIGGDAPATHR